MTTSVWKKLQLDLDLSDGEERLVAINPTKSFIVQAPAGSGKTALLTQRFLVLLSVVEKPEQIVAMTFTKKAAAEMRERIFASLQLSLSPLDAKASLFARNTWLLSQAALQQNQRQNWQLLKNPNRLRIRTIDSMNGYLVQQMPFLSRMGAQPQMAEQNDELYRQAVREVFKNTMVADAVGELLRLVNGRYNKAENLLVQMLQKRDQWMRHLTALGDEEGRLFLESSLADLVEQERSRAMALLGNRFELFNQIVDLEDYAVQNGYDAAVALKGIDFSSQQTDINAWRTLANWLFTGEGKLRKTVTKAQGFPAGKGEAKEFKNKFIAVLSDCRAASYFDDFELGLQILKSLPDPQYSEDQWQSLSHLIALLKLAVAHLKLVFQQAGQADFIEVSQAASQALGTETEPTDLAEKLDYQLKHLLIDEFQDTSIAQFDLVKKLTATWIDNDGRSLFIVGDPMQSIYRFREAEVGNFLIAWQGVLGSLHIQPLSLSVNFRSKKALVDWVNYAFKQALPKQDNIQKGAVSYTASLAFSQDDVDMPKPTVVTRWALNQEQDEEVAQVVADVRAVLSADESIKQPQNIGILGRSRSHLMPIAVALKNAGIAFRAVELEGLADLQEIQDAVALTRALLHLGDRPAWVALLRSPLIGLSLQELYQLLGENDDYFQTPVWVNLQEKNIACAEKITILQEAINDLGDKPFSRLVRETWLKLDGAQTVVDEIALDNLATYWVLLGALLENISAENLDIKLLDNALKKLYAEADSSPESSQIELMTMHKSKGLEFDLVFLPGLGRLPRNDDSALVSWLAFNSEKGDGLVLSPLHRRGQNTLFLTKLIKQFEQEKQTYEWARLLYVAVTRAKNKVYLYASVKFKEQEEQEEDSPTLKAPEKSLLACLWPVVEDDFLALIDTYKPVAKIAITNQVIPKISRLPKNRVKFVEQFIQTNMNNIKPENTENLTVELDLNSAQSANFVTAIGNLVHAILEEAVHQSITAWQWHNIKQRFPAYEVWLLQNGVLPSEMAEAMQRLSVSLKHAVNNKKLSWSLQKTHLESSTELAFTSKFVTEGIQHHIIDRSFIDEQGIRWIIDYKTSFYTGDEAGEKAFITKQITTYKPQLQRYGELFKARENNPQKWILYFSYLDAWVEVS